MTTHTITQDQMTDKGYCISVDPTFRIGGMTGRYALGISPEGRPGRQTDGAERTTDLFGWLQQTASVLSAHPSDEPDSLRIELHDTILLEGHGAFQVEHGIFRSTIDLIPQKSK